MLVLAKKKKKNRKNMRNKSKKKIHYTHKHRLKNASFNYDNVFKFLIKDITLI